MQMNMPHHYIQEKGVISRIATLLPAVVGERAYIVMDHFAYSQLSDQVVQSFEQENVAYELVCCEGECSLRTIEQVLAILREFGSACIVGIGGGKVLDIAKAVGHYGQIKTIMVPTLASTDGACSQLAVLYEEDGTFREYLQLNNNPDGVVVDTAVIAKAPVRFLRAGIGDALSTYFETEAGYRGDMERYGKSAISHTARVLSRACFETIMANGHKAVEATSHQRIDEPLEQVIEAIIYLSCAGFENGALAGAHAVANALATNTRYHKWLHGEKVAVGTVVQMLLEEQPQERINRVESFCHSIGLPYKLSHLGVEVQDVIELAALTCREDQPIHRMREVWTRVEAVQAAMMASI